MKRFEDKVLLVTGGARGLGLAIAKRFYEEGASVARLDVNDDNLAGTWPQFPDDDRLHDAVADVRDRRQVRDAVGQAVDRFGRIDVCVRSFSS